VVVKPIVICRLLVVFQSCLCVIWWAADAAAGRC